MSQHKAADCMQVRIVYLALGSLIVASSCTCWLLVCKWELAALQALRLSSSPVQARVKEHEWDKSRPKLTCAEEGAVILSKATSFQEQLASTAN